MAGRVGGGMEVAPAANPVPTASLLVVRPGTPPRPPTRRIGPALARLVGASALLAVLADAYKAMSAGSGHRRPPRRGPA